MYLSPVTIGYSLLCETKSATSEIWIRYMRLFLDSTYWSPKHEINKTAVHRLADIFLLDTSKTTLLKCHAEKTKHITNISLVICLKGSVTTYWQQHNLKCIYFLECSTIFLFEVLGCNEYCLNVMFTYSDATPLSMKHPGSSQILNTFCEWRNSACIPDNESNLYTWSPGYLEKMLWSQSLSNVWFDKIFWWGKVAQSHQHTKAWPVKNNSNGFLLFLGVL